jgi:hypothetical protein
MSKKCATFDWLLLPLRRLLWLFGNCYSFPYYNEIHLILNKGNVKRNKSLYSPITYHLFLCSLISIRKPTLIKCSTL